MPYISEKFHYQNQLQSDISHFTLIQKFSHLLSPSYHSCQISIRCSLMTKHFIHKKILWFHLVMTCILKCTSKICKPSSTNNWCVMYHSNSCSSVFIVKHQQVIKCVQIRNTYSYDCLYNVRKYTHYYLHSTKKRLCYWLQTLNAANTLSVLGIYNTVLAVYLTSLHKYG